jgi:formate hydrogenlyase subunit 6/NADH:ubiquinone oxidoreductase subunit I
MFYVEEESEPFNCIACGICARACPAEALAVVDVEEQTAS